MDFSKITDISIDNKNIIKISKDTTTLWEKGKSLQIYKDDTYVLDPTTSPITYTTVKVGTGDINGKITNNNTLTLTSNMTETTSGNSRYMKMGAQITLPIAIKITGFDIEFSGQGSFYQPGNWGSGAFAWCMFCLMSNINVDGVWDSARTGGAGFGLPNRGGYFEGYPFYGTGHGDDTTAHTWTYNVNHLTYSKNNITSFVKTSYLYWVIELSSHWQSTSYLKSGSYLTIHNLKIYYE